MTILITGASGMLGQALMAEAKRRRRGDEQGQGIIGAARHHCDLTLDLEKEASILATLTEADPQVVINAAGLVSLDQCAADPGLSYRINARAVAILTQWCRERGRRLIQISTDHWYRGDGHQLHRETDPIQLLNDYARSKQAGEGFALSYEGSLVVRTNITGFRGWPGRPTFIEWAMAAIHNDLPVTLFEDFITSTLDTPAFARILFDLLDQEVLGLLNVSCREAVSKQVFVESLARALERPLNHVKIGRVTSLPTPRGESLGLDVSRAQERLGYLLPDLEQVIRSLVNLYLERKSTP
ncbi:MAG: sugar nucleotide-binding protein [Magnetococcales bacterium]|nr:sugar nucleotide-binding protein [Magnetococcales bacterium]